MTILVTGGAAYSGSHTVRHLQRSGHSVLVLDSWCTATVTSASRCWGVPLTVGQLGDRELLDRLLQGSHPLLPAGEERAVPHFAAYACVGESVADPGRYCRNNLGDTLVLLEALRDEGERRGSPIPPVFSPTCATYGIPEPDQIPIRETTPQQPINPYGRSTWMVEPLLADFAAAHDRPIVIFRYFNAEGAHPAGDLGEEHTPETHRIPLVLEALNGRRPAIQV